MKSRRTAWPRWLLWLLGLPWLPWQLCGCALLWGCATAPQELHELHERDPRDDLGAGGRLAACYEHAPHDPAHHLDTCKVYHHVYAPDGRLLSKGTGGEFPHHRGLFLGWNDVRCGGERFDFWHCSHGETQQHAGFVDPGALSLQGLGWQAAAIDWRDGKGRTLVRERRALRATALDAATTQLEVMVELASDEPVRLRGDPQHSGHQFRALEEFAEPGAPPVRYVRPANARGGPDDVWTGCAWIAAVLPLGSGPVTVLRVEDAGNPQPVRWSTRPYGRFGATFAVDLQPGAPQRFNWRYLVALGELDAARCEALAAAEPSQTRSQGRQD